MIFFIINTQFENNMRLLILSPSKGLYDSQTEGYNGVGWVASLQQYLEKEQDIELALAFVTPTPLQKEKRGNTMYYPVHIPDRSALKKTVLLLAWLQERCL